MIPLMRQTIEQRMNALIHTAEEGEYSDLALQWISIRQSMNAEIHKLEESEYKDQAINLIRLKFAEEEPRGGLSYTLICIIKIYQTLLDMNPPKNLALNDFLKSLSDYSKALEKLVTNSEYWQLTEKEQMDYLINNACDDLACLFDINPENNLWGITRKYLVAIDGDDACSDAKLALDKFVKLTDGNILFNCLDECEPLETLYYLNLHSNQNAKSAMKSSMS